MLHEVRSEYIRHCEAPQKLQKSLINTIQTQRRTDRAEVGHHVLLNFFSSQTVEKKTKNSSNWEWHGKSVENVLVRFRPHITSIPCPHFTFASLHWGGVNTWHCVLPTLLNLPQCPGNRGRCWGRSTEGNEQKGSTRKWFHVEHDGSVFYMCMCLFGLVYFNACVAIMCVCVCVCYLFPWCEGRCSEM